MKTKIIISFFITVILLLIPNSVKASEQFYESSYIPNIWVNKEKDGKIRYQQARFLRRTSDQKEVYCIEPWEEISNTTNYTDLIDVNSITDASWKKMSLLAYYGYGYKDHTDSKWYYITQILIWKEADKNADFYFTDKLNGKKISIYENEIKEIETLVNYHNTKLNFNISEINMLLGTTISLRDVNGVLIGYSAIGIDHVAVEKIGNQLNLVANTIGSSYIQFTKQDSSHKTPPIVYRHPEKQDILSTGSYKPIIETLPVKVIGGTIIVKKIDAKTGNDIPQGDASLLGSAFEIYNDKGILIHKETLTTSTTFSINNLPAGTYTIKEIIPGNGYLLNVETKKITVSNKNREQLVLFENNVIEKEITIKKYYGEMNTWNDEEGIEFEFYHKNQLLTTKTTDQFGIIKISLPYGIYLVKQKTTKEGYEKVEDFYIKITEKEDTLYIEKKNKKIKENHIVEVPDTSTIEPIERNNKVYDPKNNYYYSTSNSLSKYKYNPPKRKS